MGKKNYRTLNFTSNNSEMSYAELVATDVKLHQKHTLMLEFITLMNTKTMD